MKDQPIHRIHPVFLIYALFFMWGFIWNLFNVLATFFIHKKIYTMPQFLEVRYNHRIKTVLAYRGSERTRFLRLFYRTTSGI